MANALALATAILWVLCSLVVVLAPQFSLTATRWLMHGLDISVMGTWNLNLANFLLGGVTLTISAWISGYIFAWSWEALSQKK